MVGRFIVLVFALTLCSLVWAQDFDLGSILTDGQRQKAERLSGDMNDAIKDANEVTGSNITPPEEATGFMRLFFTATPSPSVTPTPSVTPSPSMTPTPSVTPSTTPSVTPSTTPSISSAATPSPSKSPSPTPFKERVLVGDEPATELGQVTSPIIEGASNFGTSADDAKEVEVDIQDGVPAAQEGDLVSIQAIEAAAPSSGSPATSTRFLTGMDYMLQALSRQTVTCGILVLSGSGSVRLSVPPGCSLSVLNTPLITGYTKLKNGRMKVVFSISILCVAADCTPRIRVTCGIFRPIRGPSPPPTVSAVPAPQ